MPSIMDEWDYLRERLFIYLQVSTCLVDANEDYNWFGEVSFFAVSKVAK
jgi:hypothetical protein